MTVGKSKDPARKNKPWYCTYRDQNKKQHRIYFRLEREAKEFDRRTLGEIKGGTHTPKHGSKTLADACARWLEYCELEAKLTPGTMTGYRDHVQRYIIPRLGTEKLATLKQAQVSQFVSDITREVSPKTARRLLYVVRAVLKKAQDDEILGQNVARSVPVPPINERDQPKVAINLPIPSPPEAVRLLAEAPPAFRPMLTTAFFTGLRWDELCRLTWDDVIFEDNVIIVRKAKTAAGIRRISMSPEIATTLREWRLICPRMSDQMGLHTSILKVAEIERLIRAGKTQREICREVGCTHYAVVAVRAMMRGTPASVHSSKAPTVDGRIRAAAKLGTMPTTGELKWVFPNRDGTKRERGSIYYWLRGLQRKIGMLGEGGRPKFTPHRTRHWDASWKAKQGWSLKELSAHLGHASISETADTYAHLFSDPEGELERGKKSDAAFRALGGFADQKQPKVVSLKEAARERPTGTRQTIQYSLALEPAHHGEPTTPQTALANVVVTKSG